MTLRARLAVLTSLAVAAAILAASVAAWLLIRATLLSDVDDRLLERVPDVGQIAAVTVELDEVELRQTGRAQALLQTEPISYQQVDPQGAVILGLAPDGDVEIAFDPAERELLAGAPGGVLLRTETINGASYRVLSAALTEERFLRMIYPLEGVERTLNRMAWLLVLVAGVGVATAGGLGWLITRAGLRPVYRLAAAAEQVATTKDLAHRIEATGSEQDEVARLARSVNAMLAALDSAQTQQRQLVENAGHELRTPLATLRNDIGLLLRAEQHPERILTPDDRGNLLRDLETETAALSELVAELVDLARGEVDAESRLETDLRALVDRAVARTRRVNPAVTVTVRGAGREAAVRPATLERAIANLIRNAVQVSPDGGVVEVELVDVGEWVSIRVSDRGSGLAPHELPRLFDRFYRGEGARDRPGSGLGLAIVAQAVEQHGGTVDAGNRDGGGAVFTIRLPVPAADPER